MARQGKPRSLSLDDIEIGLQRRKESQSSQDSDCPRYGGGHSDDARASLELESPVIENLQDRLLLTPIRWQSRSDTAAAAAAPPSAVYRRESAPSATLHLKDDALSRRQSNPALLETIEEGQISCRRKSTPAVMMESAGSQRGRLAVHLSPRRTLGTIPQSTTGRRSPPPVTGTPRRRSMPEIAGHKSAITLETFYPPPRRNSLVTCSLAEVAARFELLNTHSQVPEETNEHTDRLSQGYDRTNGSRSLPPITL